LNKRLPRVYPIVPDGVLKYKHGGDFGDTIYALPTIKAIGGGYLYLTPIKETSRRMNKKRARALMPLLEIQPYIKGVEWRRNCPHDVIDIDKWRTDYQNHLNLCDNVCNYFKVPFPLREEPWLIVDEVKKVAPVVFAFGPRWRDKDRVNWWLAVKTYKDAIFVGLKGEHTAFCCKFGNVPYYETTNLLEAARVIAGAELINCSQSCIRAIAEGLKARVVVEQWTHCPNTHFEREGACYL
jgi:hypothetical protein